MRIYKDKKLTVSLAFYDRLVFDLEARKTMILPIRLEGRLLKVLQEVKNANRI